eukprot:TRINITY_DN21647_c0_g1_i1.p1 TRINITY_DN21647_c0_g1~~TRINITY_DN21647_c0_g1_i1.p1  ORF type:complete len:110 (+),score=30.59 TRINITY_DN21647_c0_g1_i1:23-331(+)
MCIRDRARAIYEMNSDLTVAGNIQKIFEVPEHDVLTAGFPCQPFTEKSGDRPRGFRDPRAALFWHIVRILRSCRPKAVSYTHLRAHETPEHLVCRLLLEKKK